MRKKVKALPEPYLSCMAWLESLQIFDKEASYLKKQGRGPKVTIYESLHIVDVSHSLFEMWSH